MNRGFLNHRLSIRQNSESDWHLKGKGPPYLGIHNALEKDKSNRQLQYLLLAGIVLASINLRPGITAIGPLVGMIRDDVGLTNWSAGFLTSIPLLTFAFLSPVIPSFRKRLTNERALLLGLIILGIGISI